jgi:hypothetical protein
LGAFLFSFALGGIARNPVGVILVRAIVSSALFGGMVVGSLLILKRYVPEITDAASGTRSSEKKQEAAPGPGTNRQEEHLGGQVDFSVTDQDESSESEDTGESSGEDEAVPSGQTSGVPEVEDEEEGLPELENLFEEQERDMIPDEYEESESKSESATGVKGNLLHVRDARFPNDPEVMAKAVKKVLKQDEHE